MRVRGLLLAVSLLACLALSAADVPFAIDDLAKDAMEMANSVGASSDVSDGAQLEPQHHSDEILNLLGRGSRRNMAAHLQHSAAPTMLERASHAHGGHDSHEEHDSVELGSVPKRTAFSDLQPKILGDVAFAFYTKVRNEGYLTPGEREQVRSLIEEEANIQLSADHEDEEDKEGEHEDNVSEKVPTAEELTHEVADAMHDEPEEARQRPLKDVSFVELEAPNRHPPLDTEDVIRDVDALKDPTLQDIVEAQSEHPNFLEVNEAVQDLEEVDYDTVDDYDLSNSDGTASPEFMELGTEVFDAAMEKRGFLKSIGRGIKKVAKKVWHGAKKFVRKIFGRKKKKKSKKKKTNILNKFKIQLVRKRATPRQIEDCAGCRMVWEQVEMDVGSPRYVEDVQASFEHNCMDAQKSTIFYGVCEDMYDDMYAMTDDYMSGRFPVTAMCMRAKICSIG